MKTSSALLGSAALLLAALPVSLLHAADDDWASQSPLAFGEPMHDCAANDEGLRDELAVVAGEAAPALRPADAKAQLIPPKQFPVATLFTFALMASPGGSLPQK